MALQGNDAAFVAAQLTAAWATLYARNPGTGGLSDEQITKAVAVTYDDFIHALRASQHGTLKERF